MKASLLLLKNLLELWNTKISKYRIRISEYQNIKTFFVKGYVPNWTKQVFAIKKSNITLLWAYVVSSLNREEIVGIFYEKELWKINKKCSKLYLNRKVTIVGLIKKNILYMTGHFPEPKLEEEE